VNLLPDYNGHLASAQVNIYEYSIAINQPSVLYRPKLFIDGNKWCALYGDNLQDGVAGFGDSPEKAMEDFNKNWIKNIKGV
jgi:hypothetical protein